MVPPPPPPLHPLITTVNVDHFNTTTTILATVDRINFHRQTTSIAIYYGLVHRSRQGTQIIHTQTAEKIPIHPLFCSICTVPLHAHKFIQEIFLHFLFAENVNILLISGMCFASHLIAFIDRGFIFLFFFGRIRNS